MAKFTVAEAFSDNMVLQRDEPIRVWGEGEKEGQKVIVSLGDVVVSTEVNELGNWFLSIPPQAVNCKPQQLKISNMAETKIINDVLIGDVWVISGQSNADTIFIGNAQIRALYNDFLEDALESDNIRLLEQWRSESMVIPETMATPQKGFTNKERSKWKKADSAKAVETFSVMGYFFAKQLSRTLKNNIPIGMIMAASGGSPMSELMPMELAIAMGYTRAEKENIPNAGMYNALMAPIQNMSIKGMIFYQGESEQGRYKAYPYQLNWYVEELRRRFKTNFPFYFVQISSHGGDAINAWRTIAEVRYSQVEAMELIENSHMVVSMDVGWREGDCDWAHPHYKKPVGERLAKVALARDYGVGDIEYASSPIPKKAYFGKDSVKITFDYVGNGLDILIGEALTGFEIKNSENEYQSAEAKIIDRNTIAIKGVENPTAVRYAHMHLAYITAANLGNSEKLPAAAFEFIK